MGDPQYGKEKAGSGGSIHLSVGTGNYGDGGDVKIMAGSTTETADIRNPFRPVEAAGGSVDIASGASQESHSGEITISTSDAGNEGESGRLSLKTGEATMGMAGYIGE